MLRFLGMGRGRAQDEMKERLKDDEGSSFVGADGAGGSCAESHAPAAGPEAHIPGRGSLPQPTGGGGPRPDRGSSREDGKECTGVHGSRLRSGPGTVPEAANGRDGYECECCERHHRLQHNDQWGAKRSSGTASSANASGASGSGRSASGSNRSSGSGGTASASSSSGGSSGSSSGGGPAQGAYAPPLPPPPPSAVPLGQKAFASEIELVERGLRVEVGAGDNPESVAETQLAAARKLRQLLSSNREQVIREVLDRHWLPLLLGWLQCSTRAAEAAVLTAAGEPAPAGSGTVAATAADNAPATPTKAGPTPVVAGEGARRAGRPKGSGGARPALQVEALWALTNIAAGTSEHTTALIRHGAAPILVDLLDSPHQEVLEQALWVLGNLAGEGATSRDAVLNAGVLSPLVRCVSTAFLPTKPIRPGTIAGVTLPPLAYATPAAAVAAASAAAVAAKIAASSPGTRPSLSMLRIGSWALSNLLDGQPRPQGEVAGAVPTLTRLLRESGDDSEVLSHTCWALSHLCDGPSTHIKAVVEAGVCWRLVELLAHKSWRVVKPALRTIGNMVCAEDDVDYTRAIIDAGAVPCLKVLISHGNREIQKEACWTLSNIAAGTVEQIQTVLDSGALPPLVSLATSPSTDSEVRSEAYWVVLNATSCGSNKQIEYLVREGCVPILGELLGESSMVMMALEGLERVLQVGEEAARSLALAGVGGLTGGPDGNGHSSAYSGLLPPIINSIERLEAHKSSAIAKRASRIWKLYFVTCAICKRSSFSRHSPDVVFCAECKCHVCRNCDCSVYHLSYQEELWSGLVEQEGAARRANEAARKNKKARKKKKEKERRGTGRTSADGEANSNDSGDEEDSGDDLANSATSVAAAEAALSAAKAAAIAAAAAAAAAEAAAAAAAEDEPGENAADKRRKRGKRGPKKRAGDAEGGSGSSGGSPGAAAPAAATAGLEKGGVLPRGSRSPVRVVAAAEGAKRAADEAVASSLHQHQQGQQPQALESEQRKGKTRPRAGNATNGNANSGQNGKKVGSSNLPKEERLRSPSPAAGGDGEWITSGRSKAKATAAVASTAATAAAGNSKAKAVPTTSAPALTARANGHAYPAAAAAPAAVAAAGGSKPAGMPVVGLQRSQQQPVKMATKPAAPAAAATNGAPTVAAVVRGGRPPKGHLAAAAAAQASAAAAASVKSAGPPSTSHILNAPVPPGTFAAAPVPDALNGPRPGQGHPQQQQPYSKHVKHVPAAPPLALSMEDFPELSSAKPPQKQGHSSSFGNGSGSSGIGRAVNAAAAVANGSSGGMGAASSSGMSSIVGSAATGGSADAAALHLASALAHAPVDPLRSSTKPTRLPLPLDPIAAVRLDSPVSNQPPIGPPRASNPSAAVINGYGGHWTSDGPLGGAWGSPTAAGTPSSQPFGLGLPLAALDVPSSLLPPDPFDPERKDRMQKGEDLVAYLQRTGSILLLAEAMDREGYGEEEGKEAAPVNVFGSGILRT